MYNRTLSDEQLKQLAHQYEDRANHVHTYNLFLLIDCLPNPEIKERAQRMIAGQWMLPKIQMRHSDMQGNLQREVLQINYLFQMVEVRTVFAGDTKNPRTDWWPLGEWYALFLPEDVAF